ncbi:MAG: tetratricopeptide repeat protein [Spirochaetaceae bacterium]|jgi:tetratricopeptide (TPR) repeat protein|nr:tetratricopeptide repeat protein [Spirochaetaceae bacterium]
MTLAILILLVIVLVIAIAVIVAFLVVGYKRGGTKRGIKKSKSKDEAIREANKRLAQNPRDAVALNYLADVYFDAEDWDKAYQTYEMLAEMPNVDGELDQIKINLRAAITATKLNNMEAAYKFLVVARAFDQNNAAVNFQMGALEFQRGNYEKAVQMLQQTISRTPEDPPALRTLGHALFRLRRPKEAMNYIRKAIDAAPDDKESLFTLAECYAEVGQKDQALRIYSHLRADEVWGAQACLASGLIQAGGHQDQAAIADFEIGLKHANIKEDIEVALNYELALTYLRTQDITTAMAYLQRVKTLRESYKDIDELIEQNRELSASKNLQVFSMGPSAEFIALCRKIVMTYFSKARVTITKTQMTGNDWTDITAEIDTPKWSNIVMFRFIRTQGMIGELVVRDFHSHLKEAKADKGICAGVGTYSDDAKRFTEARLIDLIDRERLLPILNTVDSKLLASAAAPKKQT